MDKDDKLQELEEKLAHYEELYNRGELSQKEYDTLISEGKKKAERIKSIDNLAEGGIVDPEREEAREIWLDVQKQYAEGVLSKEEFHKYKKMFENYQFRAPGNDLRDLQVIGIGFVAIAGLVYLLSRMK